MEAMSTMLEQLIGLFRVRYPYRSALELQRANTTVAVALLAIIGGVFSLFVLVLPSLLGVRPLVLTHAVGAFLLVSGVLAVVFAQQGRASLGAAIIVATVLALAGSTTLVGPFTRLGMVVLILPIVVASLLLNWQSTMLATFAIIGLVIQNTLNYSGEGISNTFVGDVVSEMATISTGYFMIGVVLALLSGSLQTLARRTVRALSQSQTLSIEGLALGALDEEAAGQQVLRIIEETLDIPYAQIFLTRSDGSIRRRLSRTEASEASAQDEQVLREVRIRGTSLLAERSDDALLRSHLQPNADAALLVPVQFGGTWHGVLDVQGRSAQITSSETRLMLEMLAQHLAAAIQHQQALRDAHAEAEALQNTVNQQRARLIQLEKRQQSETNQRWIDYMQQRGSGALGFDFNGVEGLHLAENLTPELEAVLNMQGLEITQEGDHQRVSVPVRLRDQSLGALSFRLPPGRSLSLREAELVQSSVQRLVLEMENKLLFQQAQSQAQRERQANEVASVLLGSTDIQTVVQFAAQRFTDILGAVQTQIVLQPGAAPAMEPSVEKGP